MDGFQDDGSGDDGAEEVGGFGDAFEEVDDEEDIKPTSTASTVPPEKGGGAPVAGLAERLFCRVGGDAVLDEEDDNEVFTLVFLFFLPPPLHVTPSFHDEL